jgi:hypothetical protein
MLYRSLADVMMVLHGALLVFFLIGGFLAWRWIKVVWAHILLAGYNFVIVLADFKCPVTEAEKWFMREGGETPYAGGYINHYLDGTIWPEGATPIAEKVAFAIFIASYIGLFFYRRHTRRHRTTPVHTATPSP